MKGKFYQSSFTREYQNFHLSKRDEPKLPGYQSAKGARFSPGVLWAPVKNIERQNYQVLIQGTASFCTQRSVHGQATEEIQEGCLPDGGQQAYLLK